MKVTGRGANCLCRHASQAAGAVLERNPAQICSSLAQHTLPRVPQSSCCCQAPLCNSSKAPSCRYGAIHLILTLILILCPC